MIFRQYLDTEPVIAASYLLGCAGKGAGAVVDPVERIEPYLRDAERLRIPIRYVVDTHIHADHEGAEALFASAERLRALPDHVEVYPGAFSGSVCGRGLSGKPSSTVGFERRFNRAFSETDRRTFVELMLREVPPRPPRAEEIRARNLGLTAAA